MPARQREGLQHAACIDKRIAVFVSSHPGANHHRRDPAIRLEQTLQAFLSQQDRVQVLGFVLHIGLSSSCDGRAPCELEEVQQLLLPGPSRVIRQAVLPDIARNPAFLQPVEKRLLDAMKQRDVVRAAGLGGVRSQHEYDSL